MCLILESIPIVFDILDVICSIYGSLDKEDDTRVNTRLNT